MKVFTCTVLTASLVAFAATRQFSAATSAEDMAQTLHDLGVPARGQ